MLARIRTRAFALIAVAGLFPLGLLGALAIHRARDALLVEVTHGKTDLARRAATEIDAAVEKYVDTLRRLSRALSPSLQISPEQAHGILLSYGIDTPAFHSLVYVDAAGRAVATSRAELEQPSGSSEEAVREALAGREHRSRVIVGDVPEIVIAVPQVVAGRVSGALVAVVDITEMWNVVDQMSVGQRGWARVVDADGTLIAGGTGALKRRVYSHDKDSSGELVARLVGGEVDVVSRYDDPEHGEVLAVGQPVIGLHWALILEQPVAEALGPIRSFTSFTLLAAFVLLGLAGLLGYYGARTVVEPIEALRRRADEIARGLLDQRVEVSSPQELAALAEAMNQMCTDLIRLQEDVRKKERIATLGRLAAGLAHDLKHPIKSLQANAQLVIDYPDDPRARRIFTDVVKREFSRLERFLDDLKRVSRDEPMRIVQESLDAATVVRGFAEELRSGGAPAGVEVVLGELAEGAPIYASHELLGRVLANLASNAFEAMEGEGTLTLGVVAASPPGNDCVEVWVRDTGAGIAPERVAGLFNDFATTKKRGLGLGLAVCKRIVADHGGSFEVQSEVGRGTEFRIRLPRRHASLEPSLRNFISTPPSIG